MDTPPNTPKLTYEQWEKISQYLTDRFKNKPCYVCDSNSWAIYDDIFALVGSDSVRDFANHSLDSEEARFIELVAIKCGTCGHVITFDAGQVLNG